MVATVSATDRLVIAGPSSLLDPSSSASPRQFLLLPHPRTGLPAYFLPSASSPATTSSTSAEEYDEVYELQSSKSERKARSWFLGGSRGRDAGATERDGEGDTGDVEGESAEARGLAGEKGWVIQDSSLHLLSRIDPAFLLLPMLDVLLPSPAPAAASAPSSSSLLADTGAYLPPEDLFESIAATMHHRLLEAHSRMAGKGKGEAAVATTLAPTTTEEGIWPDISAFGQLALARKALAQLCSTQQLGGGGGGAAGSEQYFRPSPRRIVSFLQRKVLALSTAEVFRSHPATLGRMLDRAVDDPLQAIARANGGLDARASARTTDEGEGDGEGEGEGDVKARRVRTELALDLVRAYVPVGGRIEELFESVVKSGLMGQLDREENAREDHEAQEVGGDEGGEEEGEEDAEAEAVLREQEGRV